MKRFLLLIVMTSLLVLNGCASVQAQSQQTPPAAVQAQSPQTPPAAGDTYVLPAEIIIHGETAKLVTDASEAKALAEEAKKNVCVKEIKPKNSNLTLYLVFCGTPIDPYCVPTLPGQPKRCY